MFIMVSYHGLYRQGESRKRNILGSLWKRRPISIGNEQKPKMFSTSFAIGTYLTLPPAFFLFPLLIFWYLDTYLYSYASRYLLSRRFHGLMDIIRKNRLELDVAPSSLLLINFSVVVEGMWTTLFPELLQLRLRPVSKTINSHI